MGAADVVHSYLRAMTAGRWEEGFDHFAPDVTGYVPGRSALAGRKQGRAEVEGYIRAVLERFGGRARVEVLDVLEGREHVGVLVREVLGGPGDGEGGEVGEGAGPAGGGPFELLRLNTYRVRDGRIVEVRIFESDQDAADEHLG
ncbi:hypothetical protein GCM10027586_15680 [Kineococcus gypseus]|uniref:nuclear transport factor 2 family protein n=1 Tax=Kineococcus gypseus TaxID=1637102 RepID=UPI003D7E1785